MPRDAPPEIGKPKKPSVRSVVAWVDEMVARGNLAPGQWLVEVDLAEQLGASRNVIREALRYLAGEGVVELIRNRACRIREIGPGRLADMLEVFSTLIRAALERLVAKPISTADKKTLKSKLRILNEACSNGSDYDRLQGVFQYHNSICRLSGNDYFIEVLDQLHVHHYSHQRSFQYYIRAHNPAQLYSEITQLILQGNAD